MKNLHLLLIIISFFLGSCASKKYKDISYLDENSKIETKPTLNIFTTKKSKFSNTPVLIFVHGGNWNSGDKKMYSFIGRNFAKKGITTVIVGYTLSPEANYDVMAKEVAKAVLWTKENISQYKGNPEKIYLTGHSAGGHLIALVGTNPKYLKDKSIIKGIILTDAAGLDMNYYLKNNHPTEENDYLTTWSNEPEQWKDASPIYFIDALTPKMMLYVGTKTYPSIKEGNERFIRALNEFQPTVKPIFLKKKHAPMVIQFINPCNKRFQEIIDFMNSIN